MRLALLAQILLTSALLTSVACGGDLTELEGVYQIVSWTESETGCDSEGDSILEMESDDHFYLKAEDLFGQEFLNLVTCEGSSACSALAAEDTINLGFGLDSGSDGDGWKGSGYTLGGSVTCSGEVRNNLLTESEDGTLRFEIRRTFVDDVPLDADEFCDSDAALEMAKSQGCEGLEVITGSPVSDL